MSFVYLCKTCTRMLECFGWLTRYCNAVPNVFWVVVRLPSCLGWLPGCFYAVAMVFLWLLECCYMVIRVF